MRWQKPRPTTPPWVCRRPICTAPTTPRQDTSSTGWPALLRAISCASRCESMCCLSVARHGYRPFLLPGDLGTNLLLPRYVRYTSQDPLHLGHDETRQFPHRLPHTACLMQSGRFDEADRLFISVPASWDSVVSQNMDLKELLPEHYLPDQSFLRNAGE